MEDLSTIVIIIEQELMVRLKLKKRPAVGICFTCEPDFTTAHWCTNMEREDGIELFKDTAIKMQGEVN